MNLKITWIELGKHIVHRLRRQKLLRLPNLQQGRRASEGETEEQVR